MNENGRDLFSRNVLTLVGVLFVGIVGSGLARYLLGVAGYNTLGRFVFILGYGTMVLVLWYVWLRPLDLTGPN